MKILECSSKGDKRFSAFYARVLVFGKENSIENHYQLSKRIGDFTPTHWKEVKGKQPTHIVVNGVHLDLSYLSSWYKYLWAVYLDNNPTLVDYAKQFDDFSDMFRGKSINCQADVIRQYVKKGRESIYNEIQDFIQKVIPSPQQTKVVNKYAEEYDVYIGRGSKWGNPFTHKDETKAEYRVSSREEAIEKYREWIMNQPELLKDLHELKGKTLGCFCKPKACHGDVLAYLCDAFKVIVAGSRTFHETNENYEFMKAHLDHLLQNQKDVIIISGTAKGADTLGERYAQEKGYDCIRLPAEWEKYGRSAGYKRNEEMAIISDASVLFWDGKSRGTMHMKNLSKKHSIPYRIIQL